MTETQEDARTPGRLAYEAMHESRMNRTGDGDAVRWEQLDEVLGRDGLNRADMEAAAEVARAGLKQQLAAVTAERDLFEQMRSELIAEKDGLTAERAELREAVAQAESEAEQYRQMVTAVNGDANKLRIELAEARAVVREYDEFAGRDTVPFEAIRAGLRQRAGIEAVTAPADLRPHSYGPDWHGVTCGLCGVEFGTNEMVDQIACPECEARRCPTCRSWFGAES